MQILVTLIVTHSFPSPPPHTATITNCTIFAAKRIFLTVQVGISLRCVCAGYDCSTMCSRDESGLEKGKKKPWETFARRNQIDTREGRTQATNKRQQQQQLKNLDRTSPTNRSFVRSGRGLYRRWARTEFEISSCSNLAPEKRERERGTRNEARRLRRRCSEAEPTKPPALRGCKGDRCRKIGDQPSRAPPIAVEPCKCEQVA